MWSAMSVLLEKTASVIFLLPMPAVAIVSMAKRSCADRTILVAKILTTHTLRGFESTVAVLHGMCHESVLCVDVQCGKTCSFITRL